VADDLTRLRIRTTAIVVAVAGVTLLAAAAGTVAFVSSTLRGQVQDAADARAAQVVDLVSSGKPVPPPADPEEEFVSVTPIGAPAPDPPFAGPVLQVATSAVTSDGGVLRVSVQRSLDDAGEARSSVILALAIGTPAVLIVVALITWAVVGVALRPVRAAQERQRRFVSDASHELRSPVATIRQHAEVAAAHPETTTTAALAGVMLAEERRLEMLIDDLLLLARIDESAPGAPLEEVDLDDVVLDVAARLQAATDATFDLHAVAAGRVFGNRLHLERMVWNLGANAARHARNTVAFGVSTADGTVELDVDDDGPGIPPDARHRAVERFVRLDEARDRRSGGAGLGLAIVREVATEHGGTLALDDSTLGGLRVVVRLPAAPGQTFG
jgi:signal transduction histidine kinase